MPATLKQSILARPVPGTGHQIAALLGFLVLSHTVSFLGSLAIITNSDPLAASREACLVLRPVPGSD
ncbi:hypothetical protein [Arthrobacter sp. UYCo732]|uniref:hypothetical protein n=1 Tax=Arthrobacter sp. UYCo732 TaxID=3156336 RepID=UPI0033924929